MNAEDDSIAGEDSFERLGKNSSSFSNIVKLDNLEISKFTLHLSTAKSFPGYMSGVEWSCC